MSLIEPIILIGPLKAGKTTVGRALAKRLGCDFISLDRLERQYTEPAGFDTAKLENLRVVQGDWGAYTYRRQFFAVAVAQFLAEHQTGVLELGGGHPLAPDDVGQAQIIQALAPLCQVILLMPENDVSASLRTLNGRQRPEWRAADWNIKFLSDDRYWQLAKHVVYTDGKSPEETVAEIIERLA